MTTECKDIQAQVCQSCMVTVRPSVLPSTLLPSTLLPSALPPREQRRRAVILRINLRQRLEVSRLCCAALRGACGTEGSGVWSCGTCGGTWQASVAEAGTPGRLMRPLSSTLATTSCPTGMGWLGMCWP